ncbi:MAG: hypothetical protein WC683_14850 [bacterium]
MTRVLLRGVALVPGPLALRLVVALVAICLIPLTLLIDAVLALTRAVRMRRTLDAEVMYCSGGHPVQTRGAYACSCGQTVEGSAFSPCSCGGTHHYIRCACGRTLVSPLEKRWP